MEATKVYPTCEELNVINCRLFCTEIGCASVFTSESNLNLHLVKTHKKRSKYDSKIKEYYCPKTNCVYNNNRYFITLKLLKQHFLKVHADKIFTCESCDKGFSTLKFKQRHKEYCGINFTCCDCDLFYPCYESLLTHARRKNHKILEKPCYLLNVKPSEPEIYKCNSGSDINISRNEACILPKPCKSFQIVNVMPLIVNSACATDESSQTENRELANITSKYTQVEKESKSLDSKQSQTVTLVKYCLPVETQTITNISNNPKLLISDVNLNIINDSLSNVNSFKDINTQTQVVTSHTKSCNTYLVGSESVMQKSSSSTQTNICPNEVLYSTSTATHDSIHTDTSDLNFEFNHTSSQTCFNDDMSSFDSSTFFNCHIETQTDFMLDSDFLNYDDSNIQPQTCENTLTLKDEIMELENDLLSNSIDTQTVFEDVARSVESQTTMPLNKTSMYLTCRDMANMETQTETDFNILFEDINV